MRDLKEVGYGNMRIYNYKKSGEVFEVTVTVYPVFDSICSIGKDAEIAVLTHFASIMTDFRVLSYEQIESLSRAKQNQQQLQQIQPPDITRNNQNESNNTSDISSGSENQSQSSGNVSGSSGDGSGSGGSSSSGDEQSDNSPSPQLVNSEGDDSRNSPHSEQDITEADPKVNDVSHSTEASILESKQAISTDQSIEKSYDRRCQSKRFESKYIISESVSSSKCRLSINSGLIETFHFRALVNLDTLFDCLIC